jgi:SAM-dependent methyltransferase
MSSSNQDFEKYALTKRFNLKVADTWNRTFEEALAQLATPVDRVRILDYGCGDGKYFPFFLSRGFTPENIYGLEISRLRLERCHELGWKNARLLESGKPLPVDDASIDIVNCMEVIEHIPREEGKRVVAELRRILRPGGLLMISTPNYPMKRFYDLSAVVFQRKWDRIRDDPTHVTHFNHARLSGLLGAHFSSVSPRDFKQGYLYRRFPRPFFLHKLFFLCRA